jgi:LacI family transcriptional regulator
MSSRQHIALLIETSNRYARDLLHGIHDWVREHGGWSIRLAPAGRLTAVTDWLNHWRGHGVIARVDSDALAVALRRTRLPVVDVSAERRRSEFPRISIDNRAVARLAADHLLGKRFPNYAYCGDARYLWSRERGTAFRQLLSERGAPCLPFPGGTAAGRQTDRRALVRWVKTLPTPIAVFACCDRRAHELVDACREAGRSVPSDIAVLGVDDDELVCEFSDPPLSSVLPNARRTGYEAAALLARLMAGQGPDPALPPDVPPVRVVERRSTEADAVSDRHVVAALRYIREHACDGIDVSDVLRTVPVSRTLLERKFARLVGESPHRLIRRRRIERACQLLRESDLPIAMIADLTGFESASYLSAVFRAERGETPREFRKRGLSRR